MMRNNLMVRNAGFTRLCLFGASLFVAACSLTATAHATASPEPATVVYKSGNVFKATPQQEMYVLKGTTVTFQAMGATSPLGGQAFPLEKNWSLNREGLTFVSETPDHTFTDILNNTVTEQTVKVKFDEVSENINDYKTVTMKSDDWADPGQIINVVVYDLIPLMIPDDNFEGHSETDVGIGETGTFSYTTAPLD